MLLCFVRVEFQVSVRFSLCFERGGQIVVFMIFVELSTGLQYLVLG